MINIDSYYMLCPECGHMITRIITPDKRYYSYACEKCGKAELLARTRETTDLTKDLGQYSFRCIYVPYGTVTITYKDGITAIFSVDSKYIDIFISDLKEYGSYIESVNVSYLDKKLKEIKNVEIMQFL